MSLTWFNGAVTLFRHLEDLTETRFGSLELNTAFIDEGSEVDSEIFRKLFLARLCWHLPKCQLWNRIMAGDFDAAASPCGCPRRAWVCTNPGLCDYLMDTVMAEEEGIPLDDWDTFFAPPGENIFNGPDYWRDLHQKGKKYGPHWYNRFVLGRWDSFSGQRFTMLEQQLHELPSELTGLAFPTSEYDIYEGHDFGWTAPHAIVWVAVHKEGELPPIVFDEYEVTEREIPEHAIAIKERRQLHGYPPSGYAARRVIGAYGDPSGKNSRPSGLTDIMLFGTHGVDISPCKWAPDPLARADLIALMLSAEKKTRYGTLRGLMIHPRCKRLWYCMRMYRFAKRRGKSED